LGSLHDRNSLLVQKLGRSAKTASNLFRYLEENPIIEIQKTAKALGMAFNTVSGAVNKLCEIGILKQANKAQRNRIFSYEKYLDILRNGT